jgi:hypothetical protein
MDEPVVPGLPQYAVGEGGAETPRTWQALEKGPRVPPRRLRVQAILRVPPAREEALSASPRVRQVREQSVPSGVPVGGVRESEPILLRAELPQVPPGSKSTCLDQTPSRGRRPRGWRLVAEGTSPLPRCPGAPRGTPPVRFAPAPSSDLIVASSPAQGEQGQQAGGGHGSLTIPKPVGRHPGPWSDSRPRHLSRGCPARVRELPPRFLAEGLSKRGLPIDSRGADASAMTMGTTGPRSTRCLGASPGTRTAK